jgi:hypothetical protein
MVRPLRQIDVGLQTLQLTLTRDHGMRKGDPSTTAEMFTKALKVAAGGECSLHSQRPPRLALADLLLAGQAHTQQFVAPFLSTERDKPRHPTLPSPHPPSSSLCP